MDPSTMFDWLDDLWIDSCWLLLLLLQHVCEAHLQHAATANNICPVDLKKTFTFTLAARLHLQQWCQPHFPFRGALKSALCSQPWAPTREMVNELQTQIWQLCLICADLHYFFFFSPIIFPPRPLAAAMGTIGQPKESLRDLTCCDCKAWTRDWKSRGRQLDFRLVRRYDGVAIQTPTTSLVARGRQIYDFIPKCITCWLSLRGHSHSSCFPCSVLLALDGKQTEETPRGYLWA